MQPEIKKGFFGYIQNAPLMSKFSIASLPEIKVSIKIGEKILIHAVGDELVSMIKKANTFANPKHESNEIHGHSNWQTSPTLETYQCYEDGSISVPRGFLPDLLKLCEECNVIPAIEDIRVECRVSIPELDSITLRPYQVRAVNQAMQSDQGVIISPTGSGKSLIGLEIIRQRQQKALIIVHRGDLAKQWIQVIKERMGLEAGLIGDGEWTLDYQITVAMVQTLSARENETKTLSKAFGLIILDEVHHAPASTFFDAIGQFSSKFRYGLSATPNRRDGLEQMIHRVIGPAIAIITKEEVEGMGATVPAKVILIQTGFNPGLVDSWNEYLDSITTNADRNLLIIKLAQQSQGSLLILVDRVAHAEQLSEMLNRRNIDHVLAHGKINKKDRTDIMDRIKKAKITVGTTGLLGEGLDVSFWSILIMGSPISSEIKLMQAIGRIVRPAKGKEKALVYDLKDDCEFAGSSFKKRFEIYKKHGIWVQFEQKKIA